MGGRNVLQGNEKRRSEMGDRVSVEEQVRRFALGKSLLAERANRVNPRGSQRGDQAREYRNHD